MGKHTIELDVKCKDCDGTGVYVGVAERDGAGVVCYRCNGTGQAHFKYQYETFEGRKTRGDIKQIYEVNPGLCVNTLYGGIPYNEWLETGKFPPKSEMRMLTCPAWWYQSADYDKKPYWDWCRGIGAFSACDHFDKKQECWDRWDKEFEKKP